MKPFWLPGAVGLLMSSSFILPCLAATKDVYRCVIQDQAQILASGQWSRGEMRMVNQLELQFVVDRISGRVMGDVFDNQDAQRVEVLDSGSSEQSFKLLAVFGPHTSVDYLQIKEYQQQAEKPFTGMSQGKAYAGVCHRYV